VAADDSSVLKVQPGSQLPHLDSADLDKLPNLQVKVLLLSLFVVLSALEPPVHALVISVVAEPNR
jgi:hypothetical protein